MMPTQYLRLTCFTALALILHLNALQAKPLKVFILVGQSNMEGHAQITTFPAVAKDPKTSDLYKEMVDAENNPVVCEDVYISYSYGVGGGNHGSIKSGQLTAGWGSQHHIGAGKIGPEFTFGIHMSNMLKEPILLIKNAWGGKSLKWEFRPPSGPELDIAGDNRKRTKDDIGLNYKLMVEHVKKVLADPGAVHPAYNKEEGYELAGFVWFQGFNDMAAEKYPEIDQGKGKRPLRDYTEYSQLLACLYRDVRKEFSAPNMPFVTGVLGVNGEEVPEGITKFREAMAAPASMPEFKGSIFNVYTEKFWPAELDPIGKKLLVYRKLRGELQKEFLVKGMPGPERRKMVKEIHSHPIGHDVQDQA